MPKQKIDDALLLRVRTLESERRYKSAEFWKHTGGLPYKISRLIFLISLLPFFFWQIIYVAANPYSALTKSSEFNDWRANMAVIALSSAAMLVSLVFFFLKKHLIPVILSVLTAFVAGTFYNQALRIGAENSAEVTEVDAHIGKFVIRHLIPLIVMCAAVIIPYLIELFDKKAEKAAYDHAAAKLYEKFRREQEENGAAAEMMTPEHWAELVAEYDGETHYGRLKRSLKEAQRKAKKEPEPAEK